MCRLTILVNVQQKLVKDVKHMAGKRCLDYLRLIPFFQKIIIAFFSCRNLSNSFSFYKMCQERHSLINHTVSDMIFSFLFFFWGLFATKVRSFPQNDIFSSSTDTTTDSDYPVEDTTGITTYSDHPGEDNSRSIFPDNTNKVLDITGSSNKSNYIVYQMSHHLW